MLRPVLLVPVAPNAFEAYLLGLCVLVGALGPFQPSDDGIPGWVRWLWWALLFAGGLMGLVGLYLPDTITGLLVERAALIPVGAGAYAYGVILSQQGSSLSAYSALLTVFFGVAAHRRAYQITRYTIAEIR